MTTIEEIREMGYTMREVPALRGSAIGVRLLTTDEPVPDAVPATGHRYCQALMRARRGVHDHVVGFPASFLPAVVEHLEYLNRRALPHSLGKHALSALKKALVDEHSCGSV